MGLDALGRHRVRGLAQLLEQAVEAGIVLIGRRRQGRQEEQHESDNGMDDSHGANPGFPRWLPPVARDRSTIGGAGQLNVGRSQLNV